MLLGYTLHRSKAAADLRRSLGDLESHLSLTRKRKKPSVTFFSSLFPERQLHSVAVFPPAVLRLGGSVEAVEAAKRAVHLSDGVLRLCITISHLNRAMYFACDNVLWAGKTGLVSKLDQQKWSQRSFR